MAVLLEHGRGFECEGMDGYIGGGERRHAVNGFFKALERIARKSRDKIYVYIFKPALLCKGIGSEEIRRGMFSAHRLKHGVV